MDIRAYNRQAWDQAVADRNRWTMPVDAATIEHARSGAFHLLLTPTRPVPQDWLVDLRGAAVLCLAGGGGQQGPLLSAAGAKVTVLDSSPRQLEQDRLVAQREGLAIETVLGDMADLAGLGDESFDLIVHPCSNCFVPDVRPVWSECYRVLRRGGALLAGFCNPVRYLFEDNLHANGNLSVRYKIPHSDLTGLSDEQRQQLILDRREPLEFGHTLEDQIGGQIDAGFAITGFYEDRHAEVQADAISGFIDTFIATRGLKR